MIKIFNRFIIFDFNQTNNMANQAAPNDTKKFIMIAFIAFAVVFVFAMMMMLWHGDVHVQEGQRHYNTQVNEP